MRRMAVVALVAAMSWACGDGVAADGPTQRKAEDYLVVIRWFADQVDTIDREDPLPVFLEKLEEEEPIPIDVQVIVVRELDGELNVRFIDAIDEAVDKALEDEPVRDDGLLLRLGPVASSQDPRQVMVERYESVEAVTRYEVTVESSAASSRLVGEPAVLDP